MKDEAINVMKNFLFGLLMMFVAGASVTAQTIEQSTQKPATTQTSAASSTASPAAEDCGCEDKQLPNILGAVNGVKITKQDLSAETRTRVEELQHEVIDARKRELDLQI